MELASDWEVELRRQYEAAAEAHRKTVREFILRRETSSRQDRECLRAELWRTKSKTEATITRLFAVRSTL